MDFKEDIDAFEKLESWYNLQFSNFDFINGHDLQDTKEKAPKCEIKRKLQERIKDADTFILIVGENTKNITDGACIFCKNYNEYLINCAKGNKLDYKSYIDCECNTAKIMKLDTFVLYKSSDTPKNKCPNVLKNHGTHIPMLKNSGDTNIWDQNKVMEILFQF
jgi:hypothetical protein